MAKKSSRSSAGKTVEALKHDKAKRKNIPTAEHQSVLDKNEQDPVRVAHERRNRDLDPQRFWRGKGKQDRSDLVVQAPRSISLQRFEQNGRNDDSGDQLAALRAANGM